MRVWIYKKVYSRHNSKIMYLNKSHKIKLNSQFDQFKVSRSNFLNIQPLTKDKTNAQQFIINGNRVYLYKDIPK